MADVVIVDPIRSGRGFLAAVADQGHSVVAVNTTDRCPTADPVIRVSLNTRDFSSPAALHRRVQRLCEPIAVIPGCEPSVDVAEQLAAALGLKSNPLLSGSATTPDLRNPRTHKAAMREHAAATCLPGPVFTDCRTGGEVIEAALRIGFPCVAKPVRSAGATSVHVLGSPADAAWAATLDFATCYGSPSDELIVEEYLAGTEYAVNLICCRGEPQVVDVWEKLRPDDRPYDQPYWAAWQLALDDPARAVPARFASEVARAFQIEVGAAHVEMKVGTAGPQLIEIGARLPGCDIPALWRDWHGFDAHAALVHDALEAHPTRPHQLSGQGQGGLVFIANDGPEVTLDTLAGLDTVAELPGVDWHGAPPQPGRIVAHTNDLSTVIGTLRCRAASRASFRTIAVSLHRAIYPVSREMSAR